jgi:ATP-dependent DNA helicase RecQ
VRRRVLQAIEKLVGERRNELVYFNPRDLATRSELDATSIANALRELNQLESFVYVPAFRGRAIRMIRRDVPFDKLEIDFEEQEVRKAAELEKLNRMVRFALSRDCRQQEILRYFGEGDAKTCGHCDNCAKRAPKGVSSARQNAAASGREDEALAKTVRMILSGVARTQARFPCGKNLIAQMLCGSGSAKMAKLRMDRLSTFGLLSHLKQIEVVALIDCLIAAEYLQQTELDRFRPVVQLTDLGAEVMRATKPMDARLSVPAEVLWKLRKPGSDSPAAAAPEKPAKEKERTEVAQTPRREFSDPPEGWIENEPHQEYEHPVVAVEAVAPAPKPEPPAAPKRAELPPAPSGGVRPTHYWTWRLLSDGFTMEECAAIRSLPPETILDHVLRAIEEGWPVNADWCLAPELLGALEKIVGSDPPAQIRPLLAQLPPGTSYEQVQIYLKCRQGRQSYPAANNTVE